MKPLSDMSNDELLGITNEVYDRLINATRTFLEAKQHLTRVVNNLDATVAVEMNRGNIVGKNEKEREGAARLMFPELFIEAERAQEAVWKAEVELQTAKLDEAQLTMGVRIFELVAK